MFNESALENIKFLGFVVDREHFRQATHWPQALESPTSKHGWSTGLRLFEANQDNRYLFMVAENKERIKRAAPVIGRLDTQKSLTDAMKQWAPKGAHLGCVWLFMVDEKLGARLGKILSAVNKVTPKVIKYEAA
jgi:hypothetical protein